MNIEQLKVICDIGMKERFKEADQVLNQLKSKQARQYTIDLLGKFDEVATYDSKLHFYLIKNRYEVYRSHRLESKWSCQCTYRSYRLGICSHVAVVRLHNILTWNNNDMVNKYLIYLAYKEIMIKQKRRYKRNKIKLLFRTDP